MKSETNLSVNHRRGIITSLKLLSEFLGNKPFKEMTHEDICFSWTQLESQKMQIRCINGSELTIPELLFCLGFSNGFTIIYILVYAGLTAYSYNPLCIGIRAPTTEGKTYAVIQSILKYFPKVNASYT
jgi:hypothetical protein